MRYIKKGGYHKPSLPIASLDYIKTNLNYIELPMVIEFKKLLKKKIYLETGFAYAYLFNSNLKFVNSVGEIYIPDIENFKKQYISFLGAVKYPLFNHKE